ncbi:unnamed protein product [Gemmata massiliana]|uniref:Uncharacterized protein n=1 Tax=Gemmata massiliana TaxID=1210884 RepID=A0A6P2DE94_9BACT|nr:hypothetical protein [Gemmata massiliana]VTR98843.1 unnamed protein product [Gemmata massiliana]
MSSGNVRVKRRRAEYLAPEGPKSPLSPPCLADRLEALQDRVLYLEAALHHVCDRLGIDPGRLPDPFVWGGKAGDQ